MRVLGVIVSTGRCGTTSIARYLSSLDRPQLHVYHERLREEHTRPVDFFRSYADSEMAALEGLPPVRRLLDALGGLGDDVEYLETGWPTHPLVPLLAARFPGKLRVLHLTRHPVIAAASMVLHGVHDDATDEDYARSQPFVSPQSANAFHPEVAARWSSLSRFERNLYRVVQIGCFGLELPERLPGVPVLHLRLEDFDATTPARLLEFFGLDPDPSERPIPHSNATDWRLSRGARGIGKEWRRTLDHPWALELGGRLGYDMSPEAIAGLAAKLRTYERQGPVEQLAGLVYRIPALRRAWRRWRAAPEPAAASAEGRRWLGGRRPD